MEYVEVSNIRSILNTFFKLHFTFPEKMDMRRHLLNIIGTNLIKLITNSSKTGSKIPNSNKYNFKYVLVAQTDYEVLIAEAS